MGSIAAEVPYEEQGRIQGAVYSLSTGATVIGSIAFLQVYDAANGATVVAIIAGLFGLCAALCACTRDRSPEDGPVLRRPVPRARAQRGAEAEEPRDDGDDRGAVGRVVDLEEGDGADDRRARGQRVDRALDAALLLVGHLGRDGAHLCRIQPLVWVVLTKLENSLARSNRSRFG